MNKKELNTMDSFLDEGFKIERNGEVITLTEKEMYRFRNLEKAISGKFCLECYFDRNEGNDKEKNVIQKMLKDEIICRKIEEDIQGFSTENYGEIEDTVIESYIDLYLAKK